MSQPAPPNEWPLWEVFVRSKQGIEHKHCGSLHAADAQQALRMARDVYTRRQEGVSIWVIPSAAITASAAPALAASRFGAPSGRTLATSAPGLGSPPPHPRRA